MIFRNIIFFLIFCSSNSFSANSILSVVNDDIITTNQFLKIIKPGSTKDEKIKVLRIIIDDLLLSQKIKKLQIKPTKKAVDDELNKIALKSNLTIAEIKQLPNYNQIFLTIYQTLTTQALKDMVIDNELKKIADYKPTSPDDLDKLFINWLENYRKNSFIEIYEDKL